jgi:hypothetical protein
LNTLSINQQEHEVEVCITHQKSTVTWREIVKVVEKEKTKYMLRSSAFGLLDVTQCSL